LSSFYDSNKWNDELYEKAHSEKLIEKVQKNRQKKIQNHETKIAEIEKLENKTESALGIR